MDPTLWTHEIKKAGLLLACVGQCDCGYFLKCFLLGNILKLFFYFLKNIFDISILK